MAEVVGKVFAFSLGCGLVLCAVLRKSMLNL